MGRRKYNLEYMKDIAHQRNGECIGMRIGKKDIEYLFYCKVCEHKWWSPTRNVINKNSWCRPCSFKNGRNGAKLCLEVFETIAHIWGGECLSTEYVNIHKKLTFKCSCGKTFSMLGKRIMDGFWCGDCKLPTNLHLAEAKYIIEQQGGKCHTKRYRGSRARLKLECKNGHKRLATFDSIKNGHGCKKCLIEKKRQSYLKHLQDFAIEKNGVCLATEYTNIFEKYRFSCNRCKNKWEARAKDVFEGAWCKECAKKEKRKKLMKEVRLITKKRNGRCLSRLKDLENQRSILVFLCECGNKWEAAVRYIVRGHWCGKCANKVISRKHITKIIRKKKGKLNTEGFIDSTTDISITCFHGHTWTIQASNVWNGRWCSDCEKLEKFKLRDRLELALSRTHP